MTRIVLHIDRLVLRGVDRGDAEAVATALRGELQAWLAQPGAVQALATRGEQPGWPAGSATLPTGASASTASLGRAVAQAIAGSTAVRTG